MKQLKFNVKQSKIHNHGLFANEDIPDNALLIEYTGERICNDEAQKRELKNGKDGITCIFVLDQNWCIDGSVRGNESVFINHSCDPNCKIIRKDGRILFYSKRQIIKDEELTIDYSFDKDSEKEICKCKSKNCRGFMNEI